MKKIALLAFAFLAIGNIAYSQCDKNLILTSSKTEHLDAAGKVQHVEDENTLIEISKTGITITPGNENRKMTGTVKFESCNWTKSFKEGKSVLKTVISDPGGESSNVTITIEGKDGKIYLVATPEDNPDKKIRVLVEKFEEKK